MNRLLTMSLLSLLMYSGLFSQVSSRSKRVVPEKQASNAFVDRLWYGGGFGISFSGANLGGNTFSVGLSPMLGYKLNKIFSVGPRLDFTYTNGRFNPGNGSIVKFNGLDYGAGVFARAKIFRILFAHTELTYINRVYPTGYNATGTKLVSERFGDNQFLVGLGYTSGYLFSSEIYLLYDLLADSQSTNLPLVYRLGFTYKF